MTGLLAALDDLLANSEISVSIDAQLGPLGTVLGAVQGLVSGPPEVGDLQSAAGSLPQPPALGALGDLPGALTGIVPALDLDVTAALGPVLGPLRGLADGGLDVAGVGSVTAGIDCFRLVLDMVAGEPGTGAEGFPLPSGQWGLQSFVTDLDPGELDGAIADLEAMFDAAGPRLDGAALVALLRRVAPYWRTQMNEWPAIPVLSDVMEAAGVAVEWSALDGPGLTDLLERRLDTLAAMIALPRTRVADPLVAQAGTAAGLGDRLAAGEARSLLDQLARKVADGAKPTATELRLLEAEVIGWEAMAAALSLDGTPLGRLDRLVPDLELQLLRAVRILVPSLDAEVVAGFVGRLGDALPEPVEAPLGPVVAAIENLDLSVLTGPIGAVRTAVETAVAEVEGALETVRDAVTSVMEPVADALDGVLAATRLGDLQAELAALPDTIRSFVDGQVRPAIEPITTAVDEAVDAVAAAADAFDPAALIAPLRAAIEDLAGLVGTDEVRGVAQDVAAALQSAIDAIEGLDFAAAADESVAMFADIEAKLAEIDLSVIPEEVQQPLKQAVDVVADIDFSGAAAPIAAAIDEALEAGPQAVLDEIQGGMDELRTSLERFRPSVAIGDVLDEPFRSALGELEEFRPSSVLEPVSAALADLADRVNVLEPAALVGPLVAAHADVAAAVASAKPSVLLAPVDEAIAAAIAALFEATGADDVFDGIQDVVDTVQGYVDVARRASVALDRVAGLLAEPGDAGPALDALVDEIVGSLDDVDLARLAPRFETLAAATRSVSRGELAAELVRALRTVQRDVPPALRSDAARDLVEQVRAFPLAQLALSPPAPRRERLAELVGRLGTAIEVVAEAPGPWDALATSVEALAPRLEAELATYARLTVIDGRNLLDGCATVPGTIAEVQAGVRAAARQSLEVPVTALFGLFARLAPHVASVASGFAAVVAAAHGKIDAITGDEGIGGIAGALEEATDLLRNLDLSPLTGPLDDVYTRVEAGVAALDPAPIAAALQAAADAVAGLLDLTVLVDAGTLATLDGAYSGAVDKLRALTPSVVVAETLDPTYDELLGIVVPLLGLPGQLSELLDAIGSGLSEDVVVQLARVEAAFDAMLRAIPFNGSRPSASASVSVSVSASASVGGG